jgi:hypothetical protein
MTQTEVTHSPFLENNNHSFQTLTNPLLYSHKISPQNSSFVSHSSQIEKCLNLEIGLSSDIVETPQEELALFTGIF